MRRVVVTGMGAVTPIGIGVENFWNSVKEKRTGFDKITKFDTTGFKVASSVLWQQSVERMIADGVDTFVEIGPGKTLTGFLRKIDCSVKGFSIEKPEDLEKVLESRGNR